MQQDDERTGSESTGRNERLVQNAAENRDALAREARRVEATAPESTDHPVGGADRAGGTTGSAGGGTGDAGGMHASEDASEAREHVRAAAENRDALAAEARRVDATTPPDVDRDRR